MKNKVILVLAIVLAFGLIAGCKNVVIDDDVSIVKPGGPGVKDITVTARTDAGNTSIRIVIVKFA